jgi:AraC-like DNA-binding protein
MYTNRKEEIIYLDDLFRANDFLHTSLLGVTKPTPSYFICHSAKIGTLWKYYNLEYVVSGKGYIETPEGKFTVSAGTAFFLNKNCEHVYYADKNEPFEKYFVCISGSLMDRLVEFHGLNDSVTVKNVDLSGIFERMFALAKDCEGEFFPTHYPAFCGLLTELLQTFAPTNFTAIKQDNTPAERMREYIEKNIYSKLNLEEIANASNLSVSYAQKIFKKQYNLSIIDYVIDRKLHLARHFLVYTYLNVEAVSEKLSFSNPKYFSKMFKKKYGLAPLQYSKKIRADILMQKKARD